MKLIRKIFNKIFKKRCWSSCPYNNHDGSCRASSNPNCDYWFKN